ncbi:MAG: hypothetical protein U0K93_00715 [Acutalibacteraceae bacterium]|nr:hypothetical protein [Acutalibacteraceae bacterium]
MQSNGRQAGQIAAGKVRPATQTKTVSTFGLRLFFFLNKAGLEA